MSLREAVQRACEETDYCFACDQHPSVGHRENCPLVQPPDAKFTRDLVPMRTETETEAMVEQLPSIGRVVWYRSRTGKYTVPAIVTATTETLAQEGVDAGHVPALTDGSHVHLHVLTPGKPGMRASAEDFVAPSEHSPRENVGGGYQELDVPFFDTGGVRVSCAPEPGEDELEQLPGTWCWPERS